MTASFLSVHGDAAIAAGSRGLSANISDDSDNVSSVDDDTAGSRGFSANISDDSDNASSVDDDTAGSRGFSALTAPVTADAPNLTIDNDNDNTPIGRDSAAVAITTGTLSVTWMQPTLQ